MTVPRSERSLSGTKCLLFLVVTGNFVLYFFLYQAVNSISSPNVSTFHVCGPKNELQNPLTLARMFGFKLVSDMSQADLIWSYHCHWDHIKTQLKAMSFHQRLNKIPGTDGIIMKANLSTKGYPFVPQGFFLPRDQDAMEQYHEANPDVKLLQKSTFHAGISFVDLERHKSSPLSNVVVQAMVDPPLLIDGVKFDLTVYVLITSVMPLRVYINRQWMLRMSDVQYSQFESSPDSWSTQSYVVSDHYFQKIERSPSLQGLNSMKNPHVSTLAAHFKKIGLDPKVKFDQMRDMIVEVILDHLPHMRASRGDFPNAGPDSFYQLMRWDFIFDAAGQPHLLEANGSPHMGSTDDLNEIRRNRVLFDAFKLMDIAPYSPDHTRKQRDFVTAPEIAVQAEDCLACRDSCEPKPECRLCIDCMDSDSYQSLVTAYVENQNSGSFERLFPLPVAVTQSKLDYSQSRHLLPVDQLLRDWFEGKCAMDASFCASSSATSIP